MVYNPRSFRVVSPERLHAFIREYPFGMLFSAGGDGPIVSQLPFMIDPSRGPWGTLVGHMARANPQWKGWTPETRVLAVFPGPHAYISPAWYDEKVTVPTWNYATVHATGRPRLVLEPDELRPMVEDLLAIHETAAVPGTGAPPIGRDGRGWDSAAKDGVMDAELRAIVGFEIPLDRLEGKFKLNQNRSRADREGVVRALSRSPDTVLRRVAELMRETLDEDVR